MTDDDPVLALAASLGVTAAYTRYDGAPTQASREAVLAVLRSLGHPVETDADARQCAVDAEAAWWRDGAPACTAWDGMLDLPLRVPADADAEVEVEVRLEAGTVVTTRARLFELVATDHAWPGGRVHCVRHVRLPLPMPGYHRARWRVGERAGECLVIAAPSQTWGGPEARPRSWGVFAPLYALREPGVGGAGDLGSLGRLASEVAARGGRYVGTLPLLAAFLDEPCHPSPYAPASRLAWNELYLDLANAPGFATNGPARALLDDRALSSERARLGAQPLVDYRAQYAWRRRVIDELARGAWATPVLRGELERFATTPHALRYAAFRAVQEMTRAPWLAWSTAERELVRGFRGLDAAPEGLDVGRLRTHLYAQWAMNEQLASLAGVRTGLYLDLPVGVGRDSYDVFAHLELFVPGASTGAPPDPLFVGGQDWGLPPLHPDRVREDGYSYLIAVIRHHMKHAAMLRIDHVMGLHRLYWVPIGFPATDGVYVRYEADEAWAILALESHRNRCAVAGEDLGTVPPEVPLAMRSHGVSGLWVRQFAMPVGETADVPETPAHAIACLNTHDTPTFAGWWHGDDIGIMEELGLVDAEGAATTRAERAAQKARCVALLAEAGALPADTALDAPDTPARVVAALYCELAAGAAHDVLVTVEDLWLERAPQNVPGTSFERPNWLRPWSRSLDAAFSDPAVVAVLDAVAASRRS